jgi:long-subunit fatty acid transport protein
MSNNGQDYSMADYVAWRASNAFGYGNGITEEELTYVKGSYDPYYNSDLAGQWLPILGYETEFFGHYAGGKNEYQSSFGRYKDDQWVIDSPYKNSLVVNERGHMDEYNIGFGMNVSNFLFFGASVSVTDIDYRYSSSYEDFFAYDDKKDDHLYLENSLNTEGTAVSVNVGAIVNLQMLRLGVAYNSPRWYDMTDYFFAQAGTYINGYDNPSVVNQTPDDAYSEYKFRTPGKWIFSGAVIFGQSALISADYEIMDYRKMTFSDKDGNDDFYTNDYIDDDYTWAHTLKLGTEIKVTPQFAVRAGYMMQTSPMRKALANNDVEVLPAGTVPHFTVTSKPTNYYTVGLGYRFTPNFYMDLACIYRYNSSHAYAFSNTYTPKEEIDVYSEPGSLKTKTTRLALTLGYKF